MTDPVLVTRTAPEYDRLRTELIWNARLAQARSPDAIVQPASAEEVAAAIRFARSKGMKVSLRGSGHNYQAAALRDHGLLVDLGKLDTVEIDVAARRATIGAGVKGGKLIKALAEHRLAFPIGHCSDVAASGYILSGGIGWNYGEWGPACANIVSIEMVTAAGEVIIASESSYAELFWAARGAGCAFFAAVTAYELELHSAPAASFAWEARFDAKSAAEVAQWLDTESAGADPTLEIICLVGPDLDTGQPSVTVRCIASGATHRDAQEKLAGLKTAPIGARLLAPISEIDSEFAELTKFSAMPGGKRVAADQIWSDAPLGTLLIAVRHLAHGPQASSSISLTGLGGGATTPRMPEGRASALSVGGKRSAGIYAIWDQMADDQLHLDWVKAASNALEPFCSARYVGETDLFAAPDRITECFSPTALARLKELKRAFDPEDRFFSIL